MVNLSLKNVYEYDLNKYHLLMKKNKNRWSLFKKVEGRTETEDKQKADKEHHSYEKNHIKERQTSKNSTNLSIVNRQHFETIS